MAGACQQTPDDGGQGEGGGDAEAVAQAWVEPGMPADLLTQGSHHADQEQHGDDSCHSRPEGVPHLGSGESGLP